MNSKTRTVTLNRRSVELNLATSMTSDKREVFWSWIAISECAASLLFISDLHSSGAAKGTACSSGSSLEWSHSGPCSHRGFSANSDALAPLDGMSAGLSLPGQCFQCCGATRLLIVFTLFSTNCFHSWSKPWIQNRDTFESVKQIGSSSWDCRADFTLLASFDNRRADNNSNRGIVRPLIGATRVFADRNLI